MFHTAHRFAALTGSAVMLAQAGLALAQTPAPNTDRGEHMRAKWQQADTDKDGQLSKAEAQAAGMKYLVERFDEIDSNKDGKISEAELKAMMNQHHLRRPPPSASQAKGALPPPNGANPPATEHEGGAHGAMGFKSPEQRRAQMQERFNKADTNKDGGLNRAELQAAGMQRVLDHFDAIDANKDGKLSLEELLTARERR